MPVYHESSEVDKLAEVALSDSVWVVCLNQLPGKILKLNQLPKFGQSKSFNTEYLKQKLFGNHHEQSYFLYQHALEFNFRFQVSIQNLFKKTQF